MLALIALDYARQHAPNLLVSHVELSIHFRLAISQVFGKLQPNPGLVARTNRDSNKALNISRAFLLAHAFRNIHDDRFARSTYLLCQPVLLNLGKPKT